MKKREPVDPLSLKKAYEGKFFIGTALNAVQISGRDSAAIELVKRQFNAIVAENCMKSEEIQPEEGTFDFALADQFVTFGLENQMQINGHTLIWHSQAPNWFFTDSLGNDVTPEVMTERMKTHIYTVVGRYKGKVNTWDVVNEAISDDGSYRDSKFYQILGKDYIRLAFQFAREADPSARLYYNDYSMALPAKRDGVIRMIRELQEAGVQVDGVGMQGHVGLDYPSLEAFETSLLAFADLDVEVAITEFDITVLPSPWNHEGAEISSIFEYSDQINPYADGLPDSVNRKLNQRFCDFFKLFLEHENKIARVTFWGVNDGVSWRNDWPVKGRVDYPLLFDRSNLAKPVVKDIISLTAP